jgi:hypothetical protein
VKRSSSSWIASTAVVLLWLLAVAVTPAPIFGGVVVDPGQTVVVEAVDFEEPEGEVLARKVLPFEIEYGMRPDGEFVDFNGSVAGTLTSTVVRDGELGTLSFLYDVDLDTDGDADASDASILAVAGFATFDAEVAGALDFESTVLASRTSDGATVRLSSDDAGLGGAPRLLVRTDATEFEATGSARFFAGDELAVRTDDGLLVEFASGTAVVGGTFEPVMHDGGGNGGGGGGDGAGATRPRRRTPSRCPRRCGAGSSRR